MSNISGASGGAAAGPGSSSSSTTRVYFHVHGLPTIYKLKINKDSQLKHLFRHIPTQRYTPPTATGPAVFTFNGDELDPLQTPEDYGMPLGEANHNKVEVHFPMENRAQKSPLVTKEMLAEKDASRNSTIHESSLRRTGMEPYDVRQGTRNSASSSTPITNSAAATTEGRNDSLREVAQDGGGTLDRNTPPLVADNPGDDIERASMYLGRPGSPERARTLEDSELAFRPYRTRGGRDNIPSRQQQQERTSSSSFAREPPSPADTSSLTALDASAIPHPAAAAAEITGGDSNYSRKRQQEDEQNQQHQRHGVHRSSSSGSTNVPDYEELGFRVKKLSNDLQQERNDNVDLQREIERLETGKEILEQQLKRSRAEAAANSDAADRLSQTRRELDSVQTDLTSLEVKHDSLLGRYERLKNEHESLRQQQLNNDVEVMEREQRMASIQAEARMEEAKTLKEELAKLEAHFAEKAANYESQLEARDQLVRTAKTDTREATENLEELHKQANLLDRQLKDVTRERDMLKKEVDSLQDQNMSLINDSATASQNVIKSQAELRASGTKIVSLTAEIDKLETELSTLRQSNSAVEDLRKEIVTQNKRVESLLEEKRSLEGLISQQQSDLDSHHREKQSEAASKTAEAEKTSSLEQQVEDLKREKEEILNRLEQRDQELDQQVRQRHLVESDYESLKAHAEKTKQGFRFLEDKIADEESARKDAERCLLECNETLSDLQSENSHLRRLLKEHGVTTYSTAGGSQATVHHPEVAIRNSNASVRFVDPQNRQDENGGDGARRSYQNAPPPPSSSGSWSERGSRSNTPNRRGGGGGEYSKPSRTPGRPLYNHPSSPSDDRGHESHQYPPYEEGPSSDVSRDDYYYYDSTYSSSGRVGADGGRPTGRQAYPADDGRYGSTPAPLQNQQHRHRSPSASHPPPQQYDQHPNSHNLSHGSTHHRYPTNDVPLHTVVSGGGQGQQQQRSQSIGVRDVTVITGSPGPSHRSASGGYSGPSQPADRPTPAPGLNRGGGQEPHYRGDSGRRGSAVSHGPTQAQDGSAPPPPVRSLR